MTRALVALLVAVGGAAIAQTVVKSDQGKPGNQGPWPVTGTFSAIDGGVATFPVLCTRLRQTMQDAGTAASLVPTAQANGRIWVEICNDPANVATMQAVCSAHPDGGVPTFAIGGIGNRLLVGDCVTYPVNNLTVPQCIAGAINTVLNITECVP